jgi:hypothetical protein
VIHRTVFLIVIILGSLVAGSARALESEPYPARVPRPYLAVEPWPGFWPLPHGSESSLLLDSHSQFARWERLRRALAERGGRVARESPSPRLAEGVGDERVSPAFDPLYWEDPAVRDAWDRALARAEVGDAMGARALLEAVPARTLEGERLARRLLFAAAVSEGNRTVADSLYFRLSWDDGGRTASRLRAWEALDEARPDRAARALEVITDPTGGERAALALARWWGNADEPGVEPILDPGSPTLARQALGLARARWAWAAGDREGSRRVWEDIAPESLPPEWRPVHERLERFLGMGPTSDEEPDVAGYHEIGEPFLRAQDREADSLLTRWLARWPSSRLRSEAYLLRAHVRASARRLGESAADLRAAERLATSEETRARIRVVQAFVAAQENRGAQARDLLRRALESPWGARAEGELRFNESRLARLNGDPDLEAVLLRLEEGFPGEPWAERARRDTEASAWAAPFRSLPSEPRSPARIEAPSSGPWHLLLWGEGFLTQEAQILREPLASPQTPRSTAAEPPPRTDAPSRPTSRQPMAFVDAGIGGPMALILGGGVAGMIEGLQYRADLSKVLAQERNDLPEYRRTDWETGVGMRPGDLRLAVVLEGTARTDDDAPRLGLSPDVVEASWWGLRGDVGLRNPERTGFRFSGARVSGELEAGARGRWETDQAWFALGGGRWFGDTRWEGKYTLGILDFTEPGEASERFWYHDARLTRSLPGGWYLGGKVGIYQKRVLILPAAGVEYGIGSGWTLWAATEPSLRLPSFRETFVANGDWNLPDFDLPAERRYLDLEGGIRWAGEDERSLAVGAEIFRTDRLRTWRRSGSFWEEEARINDATGMKMILSGTGELGPFRLATKAEAKRIRAGGDPVPFVPQYEGWLEVGYAYEGWRWEMTVFGIQGRKDDTGAGYGDFLRWDVGVAYRFPTEDLPLGFRNLELSLGLDNLTDVDDRRWPGVPAYGLGVVAGVRALYGS